jgi:leucyl-tRNA synthetase
MDSTNNQALVSREANQYWEQVDLYVGGTEHATGHLIYSRFWNKFLFDLGLICKDEPFKKLINQGMIQGRSNFVYRVKDTNTFVSFNLKDQYEVTPIHVDVNLVSNDMLDLERFKQWSPEYKTAAFILEDNRYVCGWAVEKMSKSMYNVVNPDDIVERYGADTLRLYEMFLGPIEQSKPWDTNGIDGVNRFLKKLWNLCSSEEAFVFSQDKATPEELKSLHKLIKKITWDVEHFSLNTAISAFMICVNELVSLKCNKREIIEPLVVLLAPFAPHFSEEIWNALNNKGSVCDATWPICNEAYLVESVYNYPISFNGKTRFTLELPATYSVDEIQEAVLNHQNSEKWLNGKSPKKCIIIPNKIVNIVL